MYNYLKGTNPKLLIMSGTHGDEFEVVDSVKKSVEKYSKQLPDYLYIPIVSPSAIKLKARVNENGKDLNRSFFDNSPIKEVETVIETIKPHIFDLCISFHEDPEFDKDTYIYDAFGPDINNTQQLRDFREEVLSIDIKLLNGLDDPTDPVLGNRFVDGYHWWPPIKENKNGFFPDWAFTKGYIKRYLNPEIPGKLPIAKKDQLVELYFKHFIL